MCCPYKILIADGGEVDSEIEFHLRNTKNYPNLNYEYIRYPYDASIDDFYAKLRNVISLVDTDYILQADNDDFYLLDRIPELLNFLDDNLDYVAARGYLVNFEVYDKAGTSKGVVTGSSYSTSTILAPSIDADDKFTRIDDLCNGMADYDYYSNWYSITRTSVLQKIWSDLLTLPVKEVIVLEILAHALLVNSGKIKVIPKPFYLRQSNTSVFGDTLVVNNDFLERSIVSNAFFDFLIAVDQFFGLRNIDDKNRLLKSFANWLSIFIFNIRKEQLDKVKLSYQIWFYMKKISWLRVFIKFMYGASMLAISYRPIKVNLRFGEIEQYILNE